MKKNVFSWMTVMLMAFVCVGITACGGDDDDEAPNPEENSDSKGRTPVEKDVLTPGIYFCLEATDMHVQCTDAVSLGNYNKVSQIIKNYGYCNNSAWKVEKGDMIGVMDVYGSLKYPTDNGIVVVSTQTYHTTKVYYYVYEDENCELFPWEDFKGNNKTYENGMFVQRNTYFSLSQNGTVYYKKVK